MQEQTILSVRSLPSQSLEVVREKQTDNEHKVVGHLKAQGWSTPQGGSASSLRNQAGFPALGTFS